MRTYYEASAAIQMVLDGIERYGTDAEREAACDIQGDSATMRLMQSKVIDSNEPIHEAAEAVVRQFVA